MEKSEKVKVTRNTVIAFIAGAVLVYAVMSVAVVGGAKTKIADLQQKLDASQYEAGRLLADAKAQIAAKEFPKAKLTLDTLFAKQAGSSEAAEGRKLYDSIAAAETKANDRWAAAVVGIRQKWANATVAELRAKSEKEMNDTIAQEWDKVKDQMRIDWEKL
jgi:hypothetical protein